MSPVVLLLSFACVIIFHTKITIILVNIKFAVKYYICTAAGCSIAFSLRKGGKSGQQRAPYFLTGRYLQRYSNVTENNRHASGGTRVKR
jgi:hypothetical protein